jgi:hypothetical protein
VSQRYSPFSAMWHEFFTGFYVKLSWIGDAVVNILQCSVQWYWMWPWRVLRFFTVRFRVKPGSWAVNKKNVYKITVISTLHTLYTILWHFCQCSGYYWVDFTGTTPNVLMANYHLAKTGNSNEGFDSLSAPLSPYWTPPIIFCFGLCMGEFQIFLQNHKIRSGIFI